MDELPLQDVTQPDLLLHNITSDDVSVVERTAMIAFSVMTSRQR